MKSGHPWGTLYFQSPVADKGPYPPFSLGIHIRSIHKVAVDAVKHHSYLLEDKGGGIIEVEAVEIACKSLSADIKTESVVFTPMPHDATIANLART